MGGPGRVATPYTYLRGCSGGGALERAPHGHDLVTHIIYASGIIHFS